MNRYEPKFIETKWQDIWDKTKLYEVKHDPNKEAFYCLVMLPYTSGDLHIGHWYNFGPGDTVARFHRMQGKNVFHPIGFDAFGLPAENAAIARKVPPAKWTADNIANMTSQLKSIGAMYDWSKVVSTASPEYYRWTQWLFLHLFNKGLAYRAKNWQFWCPKDQTVLANEQVVGADNVCERCGTPVIKKELEQWYFKITDYADRLLEDAEDIDWPEKVKTMQENWIGRSTGSELTFKLRNISGQPDDKHEVTVFTTRADTLGGATFMVVSPELAAKWAEVGWKVPEKVKNYIDDSLRESEIDRMDDKKEKTGIDTEITAFNPLTKEDIPVWVADYVLGGYGTGAIMAVPAHDERDGQFAKKFKLPIRQVIQPISVDKINPPREGEKFTTRNVTLCVVRNPKDDKYLTIKWRKHPWQVFVTGGVEAGEDIVTAAKREITEETGYQNLKHSGTLPFSINSHFYAAHKKVNRDINMNVLSFDLENEDVVPHKRDEIEDFDVVWVEKDQLKNLSPVTELPFILKWLAEGDYFYTGEGKVINTGKFDGMDSTQARTNITKEFGKSKTNYRLRDWLISRQRYWGAPIPIVHCAGCGVVPVPEKDLPVILPTDVEFEPTGKSPLELRPDFYEIDCPKCGKKAKRETDTMDTFVDSSWYFLRYTDPNYEEGPFNPEEVNYWLPVNQYIGGIEHAILHLLYARFFTKVLYDSQLLKFEEPFKKLYNQGLILGADGFKMSKSKGNVVNPDEYIKDYGTDTFRMYLMFMAPYNQGGPFNPSGIDGVKRFLNRVWSLVQEHIELTNAGSQTPTAELETALASASHRTIKKVTSDVDNFSFNTAIAAMMELVNEMYKLKTDFPLSNPAWKENLEALLQMLAPFAPHITEELWSQLGKKESIHVSNWPQWDEKLAKSDLVTIAVQINGKLRGTMEVESGLSKDEIIKLASEVDSVTRHLEGKSIVKKIAVPDKLVSFVVD